MLLIRLLLLFTLIAPLGDEGSGLDPHGSPRITSDDGNGFDPHGSPRGNGDEGSGSDPHGRPVKSSSDNGWLIDPNG